MTAFSGTYQRGELQGLPSVLSPEIGEQSASFRNGYIGTQFQGGVLNGSGVVSIQSWALSGTIEPMFGGELFEKIIVIPRTKDVGYLMTTIVWTVEVWSTHLSKSRPLTAVNVTGSGGLQISGGLGTSAMFGPGQSSLYTATLGTEGDATINNVATWVFTGESGADLSVTGKRISVFSVEIDWSDGFTETIEYKTDLMTATSGQEQRVQLRTIPRYGATYMAMTLDEKDSAAMDALIYGWQAKLFGVPWWPDASILNSQAGSGSSTLMVDTVNKPAFAAGGLVMVWRDQHTWEAIGVLSVASDAITTTSQLVSTWAAGSVVVPLKLGRLSDQMEIDSPANWASKCKVTFACEVVT